MATHLTQRLDGETGNSESWLSLHGAKHILRKLCLARKFTCNVTTSNVLN